MLCSERTKQINVRAVSVRVFNDTHWFLQIQQPFSNSSWFCRTYMNSKLQQSSPAKLNGWRLGKRAVPVLRKTHGTKIEAFFGLQCAKICQDLSGNLIKTVEPVLVFHAHKSKHQQEMQQSPVVYLSTFFGSSLLKLHFSRQNGKLGNLVPSNSWHGMPTRQRCLAILTRSA